MVPSSTFQYEDEKGRTITALVYSIPTGQSLDAFMTSFKTTLNDLIKGGDGVSYALDSKVVIVDVTTDLTTREIEVDYVKWKDSTYLEQIKSEGQEFLITIENTLSTTGTTLFNAGVAIVQTGSDLAKGVVGVGDFLVKNWPSLIGLIVVLIVLNFWRKK